MRRVLLALVLVSACALPGCKREKKPTGPSVQLFVDEKEIGPVEVTATPAALAPKLPSSAKDPASWRRIEARATGGRFLDVRQPAKTYENGEARIYLQQGKPALGIFRPVREGLPEHIARIARQPAVSLTDVVSIRIYTKDPPPIPQVALTIEAAGLESQTVTGADLATLPEQTGEPNNKKIRGYTLPDVLDLVYRGVPDRVVVETRDGRTHTVTAEQMADPKRRGLLRLNNRNQWVYKEWTASDDPDTELRDVVRLRAEGKNLRLPGKGPDAEEY